MSAVASVGVVGPSSAVGVGGAAAFLQAHLHASQAHPAHANLVQACTRFLPTAGAASLHAPPRRPGARVLYTWAVAPGVGVAAEWRRWEAHLNQFAQLQTSDADADAASAANAATAAAQANAHPLPASLPCVMLATGNRWSVAVEHCFLSRAGANAAGSTAPDPLHSRIARITFTTTTPSVNGHAAPSHSSPAEQWLLTHNSVLVGVGLASWLDSLGSEFLQVKAVHQLSGDEYLAGDFIVRIGTVRQGARVQPCLVLEIESSAVTPSVECVAAINEFALRLGVPPESIPAPHEVWAKAASHGLSPTYFSLGHATLQWSNLISKMKEMLTHQQHQQQQQPQPPQHPQHPQHHQQQPHAS